MNGREADRKGVGSSLCQLGGEEFVSATLHRGIIEARRRK